MKFGNRKLAPKPRGKEERTPYDASTEEELQSILRVMGTDGNPLSDRIALTTEFLYKARHVKLNSMAEPLWNAVADLVGVSLDGMEAALKVMQAIIKQTSASEAMTNLERGFLHILMHMETHDKRRIALRLSTLRCISEFGKLGATIAKEMVETLVALAQLPNSIDNRAVIFELIGHYVSISPMGLDPPLLDLITKTVANHARQTVHATLPARAPSAYYTGVPH